MRHKSFKQAVVKQRASGMPRRHKRPLLVTSSPRGLSAMHNGVRIEFPNWPAVKRFAEQNGYDRPVVQMRWTSAAVAGAVIEE